MRLPVNKSSFRVTHRFEGPLKGSGLSDLSGLDEGARRSVSEYMALSQGVRSVFGRVSDKTSSTSSRTTASFARAIARRSLCGTRG